MSFFTKACITILKEIPEVNAEIKNNNIIYKNRYDIGIAVGTDKGLVVPVLRNADKMNFADIEKSIKVNESDFIGTLNIKVYSCFTEPPNEIPEDYVLIDVKDNFQEKGTSIYKGWMISSSPDVTPLEHPIYDLWLLGCSNDNTS